MVGQDHQKNVAADVFLAQQICGIGDGFKKPAEMAGHAPEHGIVALPTDDPLQVLFVLDPHQQHLKTPPFIQHLTHPIDNDRQRGQLCQRIEESRTVLQDSCLQLSWIGVCEPVMHSFRPAVPREAVAPDARVHGAKMVCRYRRWRPAEASRADPDVQFER